MTVNELTKAFMALERPDRNGMETTVCMCYYEKTKYVWCLIRYPAKLQTEWTESEIVKAFSGMSWMDILKWTKNYLTQHPEDGFGYC